MINDLFKFARMHAEWYYMTFDKLNQLHEYNWVSAEYEQP